MWEFVINTPGLWIPLLIIAIIIGIFVLAWIWRLLTSRRPDGVELKEVDGLVKLGLLLMPTREESSNRIKITQVIRHFDEFIADKRKQGVDYNYRDIWVASGVRLFKMWPKYNRFTVGGRFYQRKWIDVAMAVHKSLRTGEDETTIKCRFTGMETLPEVKAILDGQIQKALSSGNGTDSATDFLNKLPLGLLKFVVALMRGLDRLGWLPDSFLREVSPFHTSIFISDLKSIGLDYVYHHLYSFGNCGTFIALGKEKTIPFADEASGTVKPEKVMDVGLTLDERCYDGLYSSRVLRSWKRMLNNPWCLEEPLSDYEIHPEPTDKQIRQSRKAAKKARKNKSK